MSEARARTENLLILIPAYNEEATLASVLQGVRGVAPEATILVIDDCSKDRTGDVARQGGASVVRHPINLGYGAGLLTGYRYADRHGFERVIQMDGDGQHDPRSIRTVLDALVEGHDLVIGSRFGEGVRRYKAPFLRLVGMRLFRWIASRALKQTITDPTSGFQGLSRKLVHFHARGNHFPQDYPDADILILVGRAGFRICEVPVTMYEKPDGASIHSGLRPLYYVAKMALSILIVVLETKKTVKGESASPSR